MSGNQDGPPPIPPFNSEEDIATVRQTLDDGHKAVDKLVKGLVSLEHQFNTRVREFYSKQP